MTAEPHALAPSAASHAAARVAARAPFRATSLAHDAARVAARAPFRATSLAHAEHGAAVTGTLPPWLRGDLVRTAPAAFSAPGWEAAHWFDAYGMLYAFRLDGARVSFRQRMLESTAWARAQAGQARVGTFATPMQRSFWQRLIQPVPAMTDNANVNVVPFGDDRVALTETCHQLLVDPDTLAVRGRVTWDDRLGDLATTAHPQWDPARRVVVNAALVMTGASPHVLLLEHAPSSRTRRVIARLPRKRLPYVHSFGLTAEHVLVVEHPLTVKPTHLLWSNAGFLDHFRWDEAAGTTVTRVDRATGKEVRHHAPAAFVFHTVNAYEVRGATVLDVVAHDAGIVDRLRTPALAQEMLALTGRYVRWILHHDREQVETQEITAAPLEFPNVDYARAHGRAHDAAWGAATEGDASGLASHVMRIDTRTGEVRRFADDGFVVGEPVFVGRPGGAGQGDGVILAVGGSTRGDESRLYVLDAATLDLLATARVPTTVPLGFHGSFFRAA